MSAARTRVFLLSPARLDGKRAQAVRSPRAGGTIAARLRSREGMPIGDVFRYLSGLYFRGKLAYAQRFAAPPEVVAAPPRADVWTPPDLASRSWIGSGALVMTANRGLLPAETHVCMEHLEAFAATDIHESTQDFVAPLRRDALALREVLGDGEIVLLGSIAKGKYTAPLVEVFGDRLLFPADFVGRGDMSRGGLLLRAVEAGTELAYAKVRGASVHGKRPPKL